jgi:hypothetical protein
MTEYQFLGKFYKENQMLTSFYEASSELRDKIKRRKRKLHLSKNGAKATLAVILIVFIASSTFMGTTVQAQTNVRDGGSQSLPSGVTPDVTLDTIAHMSFRPNLVGVGQSLLVNMWLQPPIHVARYLKDAFKVTFTKPDGTTQVVGPISSYFGDSTAWFEYTMTQVGTWKIKFDFIGAYFPAGNYTSYAAFAGNLSAPQSVYYKPSSDGPRDIVVQEATVSAWPGSPLPSDYWTRPVSVEKREWWPILGNYPATGTVGGGPGWPADTNTYMSNYKYIPYVPGPKSPHVVWRRQDTVGGLIGGTLGQTGNYVHFIGGTYTGYPSIIYAGRCYCTTTRMINGVPTSVWECYDLRTGQIYWDQVNVTRVPTMIRNTLREVFQIPGEESSTLNLKLELMYIGGGVLCTYDPWSGALRTNMSISPLSTGTYYRTDSNGMPYFLTMQSLAGKYYLINWTWTGSLSFTGYTNLKLDIKNNVSFPFSSLGTVDYETGVAVSYTSLTSPASGVAYDAFIMGASITSGQLLWNVTAGTGFGVFGYPVADHGKFALRFNDGRFHTWDLLTGKVAWVSELSSWPWGTFGDYGISSYGGNIIYPQYDGVVAYNWSTGKVSWKYSDRATDQFETPYTDETGQTVNPFFQWIFQIADGTFYIGEDEHSISQPIPRGWGLLAINATTGAFMWKLDSAMRPGAIADGYIVADSRDGYVYGIGKGQSAATVTTTPGVIAKGATILIQGAVTDQSPATQTTEKFAPQVPSIIPCVSDDSMGTYMDYLYLQRPIDGIYHNLTINGVPVTLTAIDSSGAVTNLGTVTTNGYYGTFSMAWTPPTEGTYTITASFLGTNSYGSSSAATAANVGPAPATPETPAQVVVPDYTMTMVYGVIAIIAAVAIVGLLIFLGLRKR